MSEQLPAHLPKNRPVTVLEPANRVLPVARQRELIIKTPLRPHFSSSKEADPLPINPPRVNEAVTRPKTVLDMGMQDRGVEIAPAEGP